MRARSLAVSAFLLLAACATAPGAPLVDVAPDRPDAVSVMVLGTYHFGNPGLDLNNAEADDVLAPHRQAELEALSEALATFRPTVIAIETEAPPPYESPRWSKFKPEDLATDRNEIVQIAFRLAHKAGIDRVVAIDEQSADDEPSYFPYGEVQELAERKGQGDALKTLGGFDEFVTRFEAAQKTDTIPQLLMFENGPAFKDDFYWDIIKFADGEDQPGAELAAYWFMRNAKIYSKLMQATRPGDRVVVVYGAGHVHWLRQLTERIAGYELVPVEPYLEDAQRLLTERD